MIYLASPYTHPDRMVREERYETALKYTREQMGKGDMIFSSIVYSVQIVRAGAPDDWESWRQFDLDMLEKCDTLRVLALPGWTKSVGVGAEIACARGCDMPIEFVEPSE